MRVDKTCFSWIQLVKKSDLPANAKYLCFYLSSFMNLEHELAWPSQKRIAYETGISEPTIRKWLKFLNEKQWLIIHHASRPVQTSGGIQMQNEYLINVPDEIIRGVADLPTMGKGGLAVDARGVNESSKGGKQLTPNNNRNNNRSNKCNGANATNAFDTFWCNYPNKKNKKRAMSAFNNLTKTNQDIAIKDSRTRYGETESRFIPLPTTYLNGERWEDEYSDKPKTFQGNEI